VKKLRVRIKPTAAFGSPLMSDTLWGQVCLAVLETSGAERLESMLGGGKRSASGAENSSQTVSPADPEIPFAVFSDGFPSDALPRPRLAPFRMADWDYDAVKASKKQRLVPVDVLLEQRHGLSGPGLASRLGAREVEGGSAALASVAHSRVRNSINRQTGRVLDGALFASREIFFKGDLDLYAVFDEGRVSQGELLDLLGYVGETGYGRDRSVGLGRFTIAEVTENPTVMEAVPDANAFMSLSHGVPAAGCQLHHGATHTKFGRHGGEWALKGNPFKNPVVLYEPGSTFRIEHVREIYGRGLENVSVNPGRHLHAAWLLPCFLRLEES